MIRSIGRCLFALGLVSVAGTLVVSSTARAQQPITTRFTLHNYATGLCLAVEGNDTNPGGQLITWPCNGTGSQNWSQGDATAPGSYEGGPTYTLQSWVFNCRGCAPLVVGVQAGVIQDNTPVITWTEDPTNFGVSGGADNQGWAMIYDMNDANGHACYQILNAGTSTEQAFNMGVLNGNSAAGTPIVIWQDALSNGFPDPHQPYPYQVWCLY